MILYAKVTLQKTYFTALDAGNIEIAEGPVYFFSHRKGQYNFLSQWYPCEFEMPDGTFSCAEQVRQNSQIRRISRCS